MKNIIKSVVLVICVIAIVFCGSNIYGQYTSMHESKQGLTDYTTLVNASSIQSPVSYQEHYDNNPDYRGWIWFESNLIDLPVMQSSDNSFYLNHDENKGFDFEGEPFIDAANSLDDQNVSIYGHSNI